MSVNVERTQSVEALRIVAAFGVVAFHSFVPGRDIAYAGLVCFLILLPYVDLKYCSHRVRSVAQLARVLLVPWMFWMLAYGALNILLQRPPLGAPILMGTSPHLWFLPFAFLVLVVLNLVKPRVDPVLVMWASALAASALLITAPWWRSVSTTWEQPWGQWMHAAAPVAAGAAFGLADRVAFGRVALLLVVASASLAPWTDAKVAYLVGMGAMVLIMLLGGRFWRWNVQSVANCTLGVYLIHPIWIIAVTRYLGFGSYLTASVVFAGSLASVWIARRLVPVSRWVLG